MELWKDSDRIVLTADKGVSMVVMGKKDYIEKATSLLDQPAYRTIDRDPTNKLKAKLITLLRKIKRETGLEESIYKYMYPIGCTSPRFIMLTLLWPIVSSKGSVTYGVDKVTAKILKPLVGKFPHHAHNSEGFDEVVSKATLQLGKFLCSYDATALFASVLMDPALKIIQDLLGQDASLHHRAVLSVQNIIELLGFYLHNTYFSR